MHSEEDPEQLRKTLRPIGLAAAATVWLGAMRFVELQPTIDLLLRSTLRIFLVLAATVSAWRLIDLIAGYAQVRAERTSNRVDDILVPLVTRAVKLFVLVIGGIYAADALDIPIAPLLASLTVAGVGFSFAAKDTVENFFGSVAVVLDRPFDIGDWVVIEGTEGIVEQVGFRSTRIRTFYNSLITVPNSNLVRAEVDNYGRRQYRRWKTTLGLQYDTTPDQLVAFTEGVRELVRTHPYTRKDYYQVWCNEFSASSLDVMLYMFFEVPDWNTELRERERLFLDIVRLANQLGVQFAFPTQTVHVFPGEAVSAAAEPPGARSEDDAQRLGIRHAAAHGAARLRVGVGGAGRADPGCGARGAHPPRAVGRGQPEAHDRRPRRVPRRARRRGHGARRACTPHRGARGRARRRAADPLMVESHLVRTTWTPGPRWALIGATAWALALGTVYEAGTAAEPMALDGGPGRRDRGRACGRSPGPWSRRQPALAGTAEARTLEAHQARDRGILAERVMAEARREGTHSGSALEPGRDADPAFSLPLFLASGRCRMVAAQVGSTRGAGGPCRGWSEVEVLAYARVAGHARSARSRHPPGLRGPPGGRVPRPVSARTPAAGARPRSPGRSAR